MKIAVIGSGISGMGAALALKDQHEVTLFEKDTRLGGHANTQIARFTDADVPVDTGFIVYNTNNYPNLTSLFAHLDVPTKWSDMTLGMSLRGGALEYACDSLDKIFAQRKNLMNPRFIKLLTEISRFHKTVAGQLESGQMDHLSLGEWLTRERYSDLFRYWFLLPMGGAIWSTPAEQILDFPASSFGIFFRNHDLLKTLDSAQKWRTVAGGSIEYVSRLSSALGPIAVLGQDVVAVDRSDLRPSVVLADGSRSSFDQVVLATHGPTSARLVGQQDPEEERILKAFRISTNYAILHSDPKLMPRRKKVWSSWNFLTENATSDMTRPAPVTYWMNKLQSIPEETPLFVSLNPLHAPDETLVHGEFTYDHPVFDGPAMDAQVAIEQIQGRRGVWYAGAYLGYGFHEDGLASGLRVAAALGARPSWARTEQKPFGPAFATAAE